MSELLILILVIVGTIIFLKMLFYIGTLIRSLKFKGKKLDIVVPRIDRVIQQRGGVLIYFCSKGVPLCKQMGPVINRINDEYKCVVRFDPYRDKKLATIFHIVTVPAVIILDKDKKVIVYSVGFKSYPWLASKLEKIINR